MASTRFDRQTDAAGTRQDGPCGDPADDATDYYQLLGVPYTATTAEITRAYRAEMKRSHPDRHHPQRRAVAEERAKLLNRAFTTLTKPSTRRTYDDSIRGRLVQDQIMGRYVGGFGGPTAGSDSLGEQLRRERTAADRRDQARSDRSAMVSILFVFGGITLAVLAALIAWAAVTAAVDVVF